MLVNLPASWQGPLNAECQKPYFVELMDKVQTAYENSQVFPPQDLIFNAFKATPYESVKVVILGQDPYHDVGQAHGLSFSVPEGVKAPPSLKNIFKCIANDFDGNTPQTTDLTFWANQGVLLLNTVLTVEAHQAHSHKKWGWEVFTDAVISQLNAHPQPIVFLLWGKPAMAKKKLIHNPKHLVLESVHPSPLSAYRGFLTCEHFKTANAFLTREGRQAIHWY